MNNYKHIRNILNYCIKKFAQFFCENPAADFTRSRKFNFEITIKNVICMETISLKDELLKPNDFSLKTPTASAFVQARSKIKVEAFQTLFNSFNEKTHKDKLFKDYRLLAIDGSSLPIDNTIYDEQTTELRYGTAANAYSAYHLNASYDLLACTYDDLVIQGEAKRMKMKPFVNWLTDIMAKKLFL